MQEKELRNTFCERLRKRREEMNITRKEFAGAIGVSVAAVGMYETGDRLPPVGACIMSPMCAASLSCFYTVDYTILSSRYQ